MKKEFTDEEYQAADTAIDPKYADNESAMLALRSIQFAVTHNHDNRSIELCQRYVEQYLTPDGFSEERPRQISMMIPMEHWYSIMLEAMVNIECIIAAEEAGKEDHDN